MGKSDLALARVKEFGEIMTRAGGRVRVAKVIFGHGAGEIHLFCAFDDFAHGTKAATAMAADPAMAALMAEREKNPAGNLMGPEVWRTIFGEPAQKPVLLQREYQIERKNLKDAVKLLPEIANVMGSSNPVMANVPVFSGDLARMMVVYYADSLTHLGETVDKIGMSEAFQSIVDKASEHGKLSNSRVLTLV